MLHSIRAELNTGNVEILFKLHTVCNTVILTDQSMINPLRVIEYLNKSNQIIYYAKTFCASKQNFQEFEVFQIFANIMSISPPSVLSAMCHLRHQFLKNTRTTALGQQRLDAGCLHCLVCFCFPKEGKQAALAADFSVTQFKHLGRLLMVHGRNSYKRSAALSQFVIHRSLCISAMQVI